MQKKKYHFEYFVDFHYALRLGLLALMRSVLFKKDCSLKLYSPIVAKREIPF